MKYVKKPIPVEAFQWDAGKTANPAWISKLVDSGAISFKRTGEKINGFIHTGYGMVRFGMGDYIVSADGVDVYPIKREIFEKTYSPYKAPVKKVKKVKNG